MIHLPHWLQQKIDVLSNGKDLSLSYDQMSHRYRSKGLIHQGFITDGELLAYIIARLPATYAAIVQVLNQLPKEMVFTSLLDLGAGPGTATFAALSEIQTLQKATLIEQDTRMSILSQHFLESRGSASFSCLQQDLKKPLSNQAHDLVVLSYVLNEHPLLQQYKILEQAWQNTQKALVILMPGTPHHFQNLLSIRQWLIDNKATIVAPCPNHQQCPLQDKDDWCHFSVRVHRTQNHRRVKKADLSYEDEKYSYLIASKEIYPQHSRIIRPPLHRSNHTIIDVCEDGKIQRHIFSKRNKEAYKIAQNLQWGDEFK